jgi:hypothetical protein
MRLAKGEAAWDMLSLKAAITNAQPGEQEGVPVLFLHVFDANE